MKSPTRISFSARVLHVGEAVQFEHLMLEPGQEQKKHVAYTNVHLYVLEGTGILEAGEETIPLSADMLVEMPPETHHRLINNGQVTTARAEHQSAAPEQVHSPCDRQTGELK